MLPVSASAQVLSLTCRSDVGNLIRKNEALCMEAAAICRAIFVGFL